MVMLFHIKYKTLYTYLALIPAVFCVADTQASNLKDVGGAWAKCKFPTAKVLLSKTNRNKSGNNTIMSMVFKRKKQYDEILSGNTYPDFPRISKRLQKQPFVYNNN